jgi:RimJ/RimL family protein N-acetyltransferase
MIFTVADRGWTHDIPRLSGAVVAMREVVDADAPTLFELLSVPSVTEHLSAPPPSVEAFAGFIAWAHQQRASAKGVCFGMVPNGLDAAVGVIQLRALDPAWFAAEWGFAIAQSFWGTGVFEEAAHLVAGFAFNTLHVDRIEARAVAANARGNGALQKIGAAAEATLASSFRREHGYDEQLLWTLRAEDWRQRPLLRERFDEPHVKAAIAQAVSSTRQSLVNKKPQARQLSPVRTYPFFVSDVPH